MADRKRLHAQIAQDVGVSRARFSAGSTPIPRVALRG
jgi:hypothetical protein